MDGQAGVTWQTRQSHLVLAAGAGFGLDKVVIKKFKTNAGSSTEY
jgi:hypothetical protein